MISKRKFYAGCFFHLFNKSIANYGIFKDDHNKNRFLIALNYYNNQEPHNSLSIFLRNSHNYSCNLLSMSSTNFIKIIAYCIMPDHYHLLIKVIKDNSLSKYINDVENSFTRYFNSKFNRKGPLWQSNFKVVKIKTSEQLLHVSRYIHLNPTTDNLVKNPEDWAFSSYNDYTTKPVFLKKILHEISINNPEAYKKFVENQKEYQRKLKIIKKLTFD